MAATMNADELRDHLAVVKSKAKEKIVALMADVKKLKGAAEEKEKAFATLKSKTKSFVKVQQHQTKAANEAAAAAEAATAAAIARAQSAEQKLAAAAISQGVGDAAATKRAESAEAALAATQAELTVATALAATRGEALENAAVGLQAAEAAAKAHNRKAVGYVERVAAVEEELAALHKELYDASERGAAAAQSASAAEAKVAVLEAEAAAAEEAGTASLASARDAQSTAAEASAAAVAELETKLAAAEARAAEAETATLASARDAHSTAATASAAANAELEANVAALEAKIAAAAEAETATLASAREAQSAAATASAAVAAELEAKLAAAEAETVRLVSALAAAATAPPPPSPSGGASSATASAADADAAAASASATVENLVAYAERVAAAASIVFIANSAAHAASASAHDAASAAAAAEKESLSDDADAAQRAQVESAAAEGSRAGALEEKLREARDKEAAALRKLTDMKAQAKTHFEGMQAKLAQTIASKKVVEGELLAAGEGRVAAERVASELAPQLALARADLETASQLRAETEKRSANALAEKSAEVEMALAQVSSLSAKVSGAQNANDHSSSQIEDLVHQLSAAKKQARESLGEEQREKAALASKLVTATATVTKERGEMKKASTRIATLEHKLHEQRELQSSELRSVEGAQAELAAAAADQLHALEDELANVKETNEHLQSELMTLERDCASLEQHDEQRSAAMEEMQNENTRLRSQSDVLEVKAREIESKLKAKQLENGELRARAKQEVDALRKGLTDGKSKAKSYITKISSQKQAQSEALNAQLSSLSAERDALRVAKETAERESAAMRERLDAVGARRGAEEELIKKGRSADEHKKKRLDAKKELLSLVRELESERARTRQTVSDAGETLSRISVQVALVRNLQVNVIEQLHGLGILDPEAVPSGGGVMASRKGRRTGDTAKGDGAIFGPVNGECGLLVDEVGELSRLIALLSERGSEPTTARCGPFGSCFGAIFAAKPLPQAKGYSQMSKYAKINSIRSERRIRRASMAMSPLEKEALDESLELGQLEAEDDFVDDWERA